MSENRGKYSTAPLYGLKRPRGGGGFQVPPERPNRSRKGDNSPHTFLQVAMSALLPILFITAWILGYRELHIAFLVLSILALLYMWGAKAFVSQARVTMTLIYTALMIVSLAAALWFTKPLIDRTADTPAPQGSDLGTIFGRDVTAKDVQAFNNANSGEEATPAPTATPNARSEAQQQLEGFMNSWMSLDYNAMIQYCTPSWVASQENPQHAIFKIRGTSTPTGYEITAASGTDADDSRTLTMIASIDKGTGRPAQNYRYEVLMLRVNGIWYVDPASLSSATEIKEEPTPTIFYTMMPTYTPDMNLQLYYNPDGGSYYHKEQRCTKVGQQYLPLKGTFLYSQLNDPEFKNLKPCDKCNPPGRMN